MQRQKKKDVRSVQRQKTHLQRLEDLAKLLRNAWNIFQPQNAKVEELWELVRQNHRGEVPADVLEKGYDATFYYMYDKYTPDELSLHKLIRNITMDNMYQANKELQDWLRGDYNFLSDSGVPSDLAEKNKELLSKLDMLLIHLVWWFGRYNRDKDDPKHAVIYSNDELRQGQPFPRGIEHVLEDIIADWRSRVKS